MAIVRWAGLGWLGVVGLVAPPPWPAGVVLLILWVAAYNGWVMFANHAASDTAAPRIARTVTALDQLTYFAYLALYLNSTHATAYNIYTFVLIEAIAVDAVRGAVSSIAIFVAGFAVLETARIALFHLPFPTVDAVVSSLIILAAGAILTAVYRILLGAADSPTAVAVIEPNGNVATGQGSDGQAIRLSVRETEVIRLVAEGYSNAMIASRLHLSESTIKTHVEGVLNRLNAKNRAEAVASASRLHIL